MQRRCTGLRPKGGGWQIRSLEKQQQRTRKLTSAPHPEFQGMGQGAAESHRSGVPLRGQVSVRKDDLERMEIVGDKEVTEVLKS